jgi:hypothetical protein
VEITETIGDSYGGLKGNWGMYSKQRWKTIKKNHNLGQRQRLGSTRMFIPDANGDGKKDLLLLAEETSTILAIRPSPIDYTSTMGLAISRRVKEHSPILMKAHNV